MPSYYLDANVLLRWAEGQAADPKPEWAAAAERVSEIINGPGNTVVISEYTFVEFHDQVLRYRGNPMVEWDDDWVSAVQRSLMEWIEQGRISVQPPAARSIDVAVSYMSLARQAGFALSAHDAIHLHRVIDWAREIDERVTLVTGDKAFRRFIEAYPMTGNYIELEEINVTQDTVPGTPPAAD